MSRIRPAVLLLLCGLGAAALSPLLAQESTETPIDADATAEVTAEATGEADKTDEPTPAQSPSSDLIPYSWDAGDLAVFVPSAGETTYSDNALTLTVTAADGLMRYQVFDAATPDESLYGVLESALLAPDLGLALTTYERLTLYGRIGWRVDGINYASGQVARGRVGRLPDGRVLVTIALAPDERRLARRADAAAYGLAFNDAGKPEIPSTFPPDRLGAAALVRDVPVQGTLSEADPLQQWTYAGQAGERISVIAVDLARQFVFDLQLDMAVRVFNPDGSEFGYNDDQVGVELFGAYDAILPAVTLPADGDYVIQVEWVQGAGTYTLGITGDEPITIPDQDTLTLDSTLTAAFPFDRWTFQARQGETYTFTMITTSGSLDPALELLLDDGRSLAYNDDAADPTLGTNAQIAAVRIPADGVYVIEAGRFSGTGGYQLVIARTSAG
ncbi:MAG: hypothetical protein SF162_15510 [bacterium]|nr:hypothetical protein [bacterium]